jgi:hypothetical protein
MISLPYTGSPVEIGKKLKSMGFEENFNREDGTILYASSDMKVEFLKPRKGDGKKDGDPYIRELDIAPQALPFLNILLENPRTETLRGLLKVRFCKAKSFPSLQLQKKRLLKLPLQEPKSCPPDFRKGLIV